ncbi:hypothetical protein KJ815_01500 [bacterium]|nr:hypothetical protein [bacterium]
MIALILLVSLKAAHAGDWITLVPNPAFSRDLAMGMSTIALSYAPQSQSINPAGLRLFDPDRGWRATLVVNPGGFLQLGKSRPAAAPERNTLDQVSDGVRTLTTAAALQARIIAIAVFLSQPVMLAGDTARYNDYENRSPLDGHQNSLLVSLALHPRVAVGGRVDRYYSWDRPQGESYSYGVILRPRGVRVGVQYQRFPESGVRLWHPLDHRSDQTTTAGVAIVRENLTLAMQVMNLTESSKPAFLEPHAGVEWRPVRALALRAGGTQFSRSRSWAWTAGIGLLDANWFRSRAARLLVPDDVIQVALGVIYSRRTPVLGIGSLTCAWRF